MKFKFNTVTIAILLGAAGLGYYFWNKRKKAAASLGATAGTAAANAAITTAAGAAGQIINQGGAGLGTPGAPAPTSGSTIAGKYTFTDTELEDLLKVGKTGTTVKALQIYLIKAGKNVGSTGADGVFGTNTETALRDLKGINSVTLRELKITSVDLSKNIVFGRAFGTYETGPFNGFTFV